MPASTPIGKSDQALTTTTAGDMLKSTGPAGVPTVAVASTDYSVPAADETISGVKTHTTSTVVLTDAIADPTTGSGQIQRINMPDAGVSPPFGFTVWSYPTTDPGGRQNHPVYWGHNCGKGGQPIDPTQPSCGIGMESFWVQYDAGGQFEVHLAVTQFVNGHNQIRPVSAVILRDGSYCNLLFTADALTYTTGSNVQKISVTWPEISYQDGTYLVSVSNNTPFIRQVNNLGSVVDLIYIDSSNIIHVGDAGYAAVKIAIDNPLTSLTFANGGSGIIWTNSSGATASLLYVDSGNNTLLNPPGSSYHTTPDAKFTQFRAHTGNPYWRYDDNTGLTIGGTGVSDGTEKLSFHGASPKAKATITGSRADGTALASLLTTLAAKGLFIDGTTA